MARATSSFPVPVSPVIRTLESAGATLDMEGTPNQEIRVPGNIVHECGQLPPFGSGLALFAMRLPLLDGRPKSGLCDAVTECCHVDVLLRSYPS
jgi:hypothetical protein